MDLVRRGGGGARAGPLRELRLPGARRESEIGKARASARPRRRVFQPGSGRKGSPQGDRRAMAEAVEPRRRSVLCASQAGLHRMAYREWGDPRNRDVLICVHGLTRSGRDFDELARALCGQWRIVCPDVVGRGDSDRLADSRLYTWPQYVADMVTLIARLDVEAVNWLGTSMGGFVGLALAAQAGSPVKKLILNDASPVIGRGSLERRSEERRVGKECRSRWSP